MWERSETTGGPMGWCRKCDYKWFPDTKTPNEITPEQREYFAQQRLQRVEQERAEQAEKRELFRQVPWWETYHHNLEHHPRAVQIWRERYGITDWALAYYKFGYCPDFTYWHNETEQHSDTLTIPIFQPGAAYRVNNLRHRLLTPDAPGGKYRPHQGGLGQPLFFANLNHNHTTLPYLLIVEGEIKAAVIWQTVMLAMLTDNAAERVEWFCTHVQVCGIPGTSLSAENMRKLELAERVYVAFDPDANESQGRKPSKAVIFASKFVDAKMRKVVQLPGKPDDLIVDGSLAISDLVEFMKDGRVV